MDLNKDYIKQRRTAIILAMIILVVSSIIYFSTNIAERNNEMMYKEIYGENATITNIDNTNDVIKNDVINGGVDGGIQTKPTLV